MYDMENSLEVQKKEDIKFQLSYQPIMKKNTLENA